MTVEQALALLDQVTSQIQATKQVHVQIEQALATLKAAATKQKEA